MNTISSIKNCCDNNEHKWFESSKRLFSYSEFSKTIILDREKPAVEQIISTLTDADVISIKIVNTVKGHSLGGEYATGKKAIIRLKIKEKLLYTSTHETNAINVEENEYYHSTFVVIPQLIEGTDPELLLKSNQLKLKVNVEDVTARATDSHTIFNYFNISLELLLIPTFELCYSMQESKSDGGLFIAYENGSFSTMLTELESSFESKPEWSPNGLDIAFLSHSQGSIFISLVNIKNLNKSIITDPGIFKTISSYSWTADGKNIIFASALNGIKDLFAVNVENKKWRQLTYGNSNIKHYMPRCSPDGKYVGFLKKVSGVVNLYIQGIGNEYSKRITSSGHIKDFAWSWDSKNIAVIRDTDGNPDEVFIIDVNTLNEKIINLCKYANRKRDIKYSPDDKYITLTGTVYDIDDIYLIDIRNFKAFNLTKNPAGISISSYCWNMDSDRIYYSSNDNFYYNIYCFSITDKNNHQITNSKSAGINLGYRPKIK